VTKCREAGHDFKSLGHIFKLPLDSHLDVAVYQLGAALRMK